MYPILCSLKQTEQYEKSKNLEAQHVSDAVSWQSCPAIFAQRDIADRFKGHQQINFRSSD